MFKVFKYLLDLTIFVLTGRGPIADKAVQENLLDFGGQN